MPDLTELMDIAHLRNAQAAKVAQLEAELKSAKELLRRVEEEDLPQMMKELGMRSFNLADGSSITLHEKLSAAITKANKDQAHEWLRANDFGGIIKGNVVVPFAKGEEQAARAFVATIHNERPDAEFAETVHHSTLKAFVKEQRSRGVNVPVDLFAVHVYDTVKVSIPNQ